MKARSDVFIKIAMPAFYKMMVISAMDFGSQALRVVLFKRKLTSVYPFSNSTIKAGNIVKSCNFL